MPNVAYVRPEYEDLKSRWELIRDCVAGSEVVKRAGDRYLPRPNPTDRSTENTTRYEQYRERAIFYNVTGRTLHGLVGQIMARDPVVDLPSSLELLQVDVDGGGVALNQQAQKALRHTLSHGRGGLLVDYPQVDVPAGTKRRKLEEGEIRPTITLYDPWDIINWRTKTIGGKVVLSLIVISEQYVTDDDGFEEEWDPQWRVLRLDENNLYVQEEWIRDPNNDQEYILKLSEKGPARYFPTDSNGKRFNHIPFFFMGIDNNDSKPDLPPLYDLAVLNIGHYRNSADYEEACYIVGQPTPYAAGLTEDWVRDVWKDDVMQLGCRTFIPLPEGGTAGLIQADPNNMPKDAMEHKERQMVALGAKLVEQRQVQRTAQEAKMEEASEVSVLAMASHNVSTAYVSALEFARDFVDANDEKEILYELSSDFEVHSLNPQEQAELIKMWVSGALLEEEMRDRLIAAGIAHVEYEEYKARAEEELLSKPIQPVPGMDQQEQQPKDDEATDE